MNLPVGSPITAPLSQLVHLFDRQGTQRPTRVRRTILQAGLAFLAIALEPLVRGTHAHTGRLRGFLDAQAAQSLTLTALTGSVAANGPSGIADSTLRAYVPLGWDGVYGALTFTAVGNHLDANIKVGVGTLRHPLIVVRGFTSGAYPTLTLNGQALVMDQDWFPSLRAGSNELWITLNRDLAGASNRIVVTP